MKYIEAQIKDGVLQLFNRTIIGSDVVVDFAVVDF
jgi:hypothetical protein